MIVTKNYIALLNANIRRIKNHLKDPLKHEWLSENQSEASIARYQKRVQQLNVELEAAYKEKQTLLNLNKFFDHTLTEQQATFAKQTEILDNLNKSGDK